MLQVVVGVIKNSAGQCLISLRHPELHQGGLWEFPGGKVEAGEALEQALQRELKEELSIDVSSMVPLLTVKHDYPDRSVQLHVFLIEHFFGEVRHRHQQAWRWVVVNELTNYAFPAANKPIVTAVRLPPYYAILDDEDEANIIGHFNKLLQQGVTLIQVRLKRVSEATVREIIEKIYPVCRRQGVLLLLNSDLSRPGLMADGVHLTSQHLMALEQRPPQQEWVAASCHNLAELQHAEKIGVDFAVLAPVCATQTHVGRAPLGWAEFDRLTVSATIPVYALGGMAKADLLQARQHGAQGIAAIRAFLDA